jgi:WD40 repeat protein
LLCPAQGYPHLAYSNDGRFVAVGAGNGRVSLYDARSGADLSPSDRHRSGVGHIEMTADATVCLACLGHHGWQEKGELVLRDLRTGARIEATAPKDFLPLTLAPVGIRIAGWLSESQLAVWDWSTGDVKVHPELKVRSAAWHPRGHVLMMLADNNEVTSWSPGTGRTKREPLSCPSPIIGIAVSAQGRAAALSDKGDLFVWQLGRDDSPSRLTVPVPTSKQQYIRRPWPVVIAPDGLAAAVTYGDGIVYAGPLAGGEFRAVYTHPAREKDAEDGPSVVIHYTSGGRLLVGGICTSLRDNEWWYTIVVTDGMSGEEVWRSPPQLMYTAPLAFCPDGERLLSGNDDGTLLVWPLGKSMPPPAPSRSIPQE